MKKGVRYIAIASGPIEKRKNTLIVGVIFRDNYIEGLLSTGINVDGTDSTKQIIKMVKSSRFKDQIRILLFNGIALAGLNVIDPWLLEKSLGIKVLLLNRRKQNAAELIKALGEFSRISRRNVKKRTGIVKRYSLIKPLKIKGLFFQSGLDEPYTRDFADRAFEALRIAHIIVRGVSTGESKGRI